MIVSSESKFREICYRISVERSPTNCRTLGVIATVSGSMSYREGSIIDRRTGKKGEYRSQSLGEFHLGSVEF